MALHAFFRRAQKPRVATRVTHIFPSAHRV
jgi:hypothetical protein